MIASSCDWHLGTRYANPDGVMWVVDEVCRLGVPILVVAGDGLDGWKKSPRRIVEENRLLLQEASRKFRRHGVWVFWLQGNHDDGNAGALARALAGAGFDGTLCNVISGYWIMYEGGRKFHFEHGHRFDLWNWDIPFKWISHGAAKVTGVLGLDDSKINPACWVSPAEAKDNEVRDVIHFRANSWAAKEGVNLVMGHTHRSYRLEGEDWSVVNCGCVYGDIAEFVVFDGAGESFHRKGGGG